MRVSSALIIGALAVAGCVDDSRPSDGDEDVRPRPLEIGGSSVALLNGSLPGDSVVVSNQVSVGDAPCHVEIYSVVPSPRYFLVQLWNQTGVAVFRQHVYHLGEDEPQEILITLPPEPPYLLVAESGCPSTIMLQAQRGQPALQWFSDDGAPLAASREERVHDFTVPALTESATFVMTQDAHHVYFHEPRRFSASVGVEAYLYPPNATADSEDWVMHFSRGPLPGGNTRTDWRYDPGPMPGDWHLVVKPLVPNLENARVSISIDTATLHNQTSWSFEPVLQLHIDCNRMVVEGNLLTCPASRQ